MSLISRSHSAFMRPFHPLWESIFDDDVRKRFTIIALHPGNFIRISISRKLLEFIPQIVSALFLEDVEDPGCPTGSIIFP